MAFEKRWNTISTIFLTADGNSIGLLTVPDAYILKVKQTLILKSGSNPPLKIQVKRVISPTQFLAGRPDEDIDDRLDFSAYTVADGANISNADPYQQRTKIGIEDFARAVYEEEPTVAIRTHMVDRGGRSIGSDPWSPFYIRLTDGSVNIGSVNAELEVALSHLANSPNPGDVPDSVRIGDGVEEWQMNAQGEGTVHDQDTHDKLDLLRQVVQDELDATQVLLQSEFDATQALLQSEFNETQNVIQSEFDATQVLLQSEFDATQTKLDTLTNVVQTESDQTQSILQTEFDQTQTAIQNLQTEVDRAQYTMNEAFDKALAIGGQLDDASTVVATEGSVAPLRITPQRAVHTNLRTANGTELLGKKSAALSVPVVSSEETTFSVSAENVVIDNGKSMISIFNQSATDVVKIRKIYIINTQITGVNGIVAEFQMRRISGHSGGILLVPDSFDSADTLTSGITVRSGATVSGEIARNLRRWLWSTDDWGPGNIDTESSDHGLQSIFPVYEQSNRAKPITLRPGEGLHIKQNVNSTVGVFDFIFEFTQE